ncbi:sensor histidine kinase [Amycolatopsis sp. H20-H5]|uniref:sensor histidine kinase n=1 Tax=Amycolatopsis sp. H20-H5 TaxID=3046309 RepID=UPI002DBE59FF|nr:HAMP domain-containing sensor histidine kinase [Amycolatopsis sp. H20-H5]MEC3981304.1 HAMP domain-containing sensor histidine kinase [Amycolatopsis sp. H20-H5]
MRRRIVTLAVVAGILAISLFGIPSAVAVAHYFVQDERAELERAADSAALSVADDLTDVTRVPVLPGAAEGTAGLYTPSGRLVTGTGPATADTVVLEARDGRVTNGDNGDELVVAVPIVHGSTLLGIVRAATPHTEAYQRAALTWLAMAGLAGAAVVATWLVARRFAARLARPLEDLSAAAARLGEGDFTVRAARSGIPEIDQVARTLGKTAERIGETLDRERALSADASHQLRTPLTGLRLQLEAALDPPGQDLLAAVGAAITTTDRLETTIDDLLALSAHRREPRSALDPGQLLDEVRQSWHGLLASRGRALRITPTSTARPHAAEAAVRQIISVLLDNAITHGTGTVTVTTRDSGTAFAIDVADEGSGVDQELDLFARGHSSGDGHGIGLALARSLAEAEGGRLRLSTPTPVTFTLWLPVNGDG